MMMMMIIDGKDEEYRFLDKSLVATAGFQIIINNV